VSVQRPEVHVGREVLPAHVLIEIVDRLVLEIATQRAAVEIPGPRARRRQAPGSGRDVPVPVVHREKAHVAAIRSHSVHQGTNRRPQLDDAVAAESSEFRPLRCSEGGQQLLTRLR